MEKTKIPELPMMIKAKKIAKQLYDEYNFEEKEGRNCGNLLLHWIKDCYWGLRVKDSLPTFDKVWQMLYEGKHDKNNKFVYGDIDVGVWFENSKKDKRKVIVSENYSSCADDNTHIFIRDNLDDGKYDFGSRFRVATVWDKEKPIKRKIYWKDDRDIDIPSLNTYRKRDFQYGYFDCRDKGHSILYSDYSQSVENAHWGENRIEHALTILENHLYALENIEVEEKKTVSKLKERCCGAYCECGECE